MIKIDFSSSPSCIKRLFANSSFTKWICASFDIAWRKLSSIVPEISPPSICATKILFNAPTIAAAKGSILSPCTTIKSGFSSFTYLENPSIVVAKALSVW